MDNTEHQFHAGMFGQYGSALEQQPKSVNEVNYDQAPDVPVTTVARANSGSDQSASDLEATEK